MTRLIPATPLRRLVAVALVVGVALTTVPSAPALAVPQISCASYLPGPPYNNYTCHVPRAHIGQEVYLQAFPKQRESACDSPRTDAQIHVQAAVKRWNTGFYLTGLWMVYDRGVKPWAFFRVDTLDGRNVEQNGTWNNHGNWMDRDVARRGGGDITRFPGVSPGRPVPFTWQGNGRALLEISLFESVTSVWAHWVDRCNVHPFYVEIRPGA